MKKLLLVCAFFVIFGFALYPIIMLQKSNYLASDKGSNMKPNHPVRGFEISLMIHASSEPELYEIIENEFGTLKDYIDQSFGSVILPSHGEPVKRYLRIDSVKGNAYIVTLMLTVRMKNSIGAIPKATQSSPVSNPVSQKLYDVLKDGWRTDSVIHSVSEVRLGA